MAGKHQESVTFEEISQGVQRYLDHPFLRANKMNASVSKFHFDVLHAILRIGSIAPDEARQVLMAVLLLHEGLSIHDDVDEEIGIKRQLTVLSGDYNSSLYYWILARLDNQKLLTLLSDAVVAINESKMALTANRGNMPSDEFLQLHEAVQGELVLSVASHYLPPQLQWSLPLRALIRAYVVNEQIKARTLSGPLPLRQALVWMADYVDRLLRLKANYILEPMVSFVLDYIEPLQHSVERFAWAEGIR